MSQGGLNGMGARPGPLLALWLGIVCFSYRPAHCSWWLLGMPSTYQNMLTLKASAHSENCHKLRYQVKENRDLCVLSHRALQTVSRGAKLGIDECQFQFRASRWNCTTFHNIPSVFGGVLNVMSREKAYVYGVSAAGVAYSITRACSKGELNECGCDSAIRQRKPRGSWEWGGCSDDIGFGAQFSRKFVDAGEDPSTAQGLMNLHNNEAGRRTLRRSMETVCKCHGVSGSCSVRVCWRRLKPFRAVGDALSVKFDGATHVHMTRAGGARAAGATGGRKRRPRLRPVLRDVKKPGKKDLVYLEESPDYCTRNETLAVLGTTGRSCNNTSYGMDGCRLLCCGRGYQTVVREVDEKYHCKFVWCCKVQCQTCRVTKEEHFCK